MKSTEFEAGTPKYNEYITALQKVRTRAAFCSRIRDAPYSPVYNNTNPFPKLSAKERSQIYHCFNSTRKFR